jgi:N-acyl-D-aspartate/D-glutamate deacylase
MNGIARGLAASLVLIGAAWGPVAGQRPGEGRFDLVIARGRVMDPASGLDAVRDLGIRDGRVAAISARPLAGRTTIDAAGLVVAPGFIDLHAHGQDDENYRVYALDGVTTALELEVGTDDVDRFYGERAGKALVNYGASIGHIKARMAVFGDPGPFLPTGPGAHTAAGPAELDRLAGLLRAGLRAGALGVGFGLSYTPAASRWEVIRMFEVAAELKAPAFIHVRDFGPNDPGSVESFLEAIGAAAITGAPLHIVHLNSMSLDRTPETLAMVEAARSRGLDVTTEAYPYSAGMTEIASALLDRFEKGPDSMLSKLMWVQTGERLDRPSFERYRKQGGMVILHLNTEEMEALAITSPLTAIASDGMLSNGKGHPRTAGTYARVLGHYVRERKALSLMDAIRKSSLMPAQRLEGVAPMFRRKGRIAVGADADLAIFDPATVADQATYQQPNLPSRGFRFVLVNGVPVVFDGAVREGVYPGQAARGSIR